jgi:hypothetical protein
MSLLPCQIALDSFSTVGALPGDTERYSNLVNLSLQGLLYPGCSIFLDAATVFYRQDVDVTKIVWAAMYGGAVNVDSAFEEIQQRSLLKELEGKLIVHDVVRGATQSIAQTLEPDKRVWRSDQVRCCTR